MAKLRRNIKGQKVCLKNGIFVDSYEVWVKDSFALCKP